MVDKKSEQKTKNKEAEEFYQKGLVCGQKSDADGAIEC